MQKIAFAKKKKINNDFFSQTINWQLYLIIK